jgi:hypothetical protein
MQCPYCHEPLQGINKFCPSCGLPLTDPTLQGRPRGAGIVAAVDWQQHWPLIAGAGAALLFLLTLLIWNANRGSSELDASRATTPSMQTSAGTTQPSAAGSPAPLGGPVNYGVSSPGGGSSFTMSSGGTTGGSTPNLPQARTGRPTVPAPAPAPWQMAQAPSPETPGPLLVRKSLDPPGTQGNNNGPNGVLGASLPYQVMQEVLGNPPPPPQTQTTSNTVSPEAVYSQEQVRPRRRRLPPYQGTPGIKPRINPHPALVAHQQLMGGMNGGGFNQGGFGGYGGGGYGGYGNRYGGGYGGGYGNQNGYYAPSQQPPPIIVDGTTGQVISP